MSDSIRFTLAIALGVLVAILPELAYAGSLDDTIGTGICNLSKSMSGPIGKAVATIAIIFLGIGAFFGKVNWGLAVIFACGLIAIFGAATIIADVAGGGKCS